MTLFGWRMAAGELEHPKSVTLVMASTNTGII